MGSTMNVYLFRGLELGPVALRRIFAAIPESRIDEAIDPDRFTPREVIAHVADWEPILLARMKQTFDDPGSVILGHDESVRAIEQGYASSVPAEQLDFYDERRRATIEWLKMVEGEDWQKVAVHNERGPMTIYDQASMMLGHEIYHLEQLS